MPGMNATVAELVGRVPKEFRCALTGIPMQAPVVVQTDMGSFNGRVSVLRRGAVVERITLERLVRGQGREDEMEKLVFSNEDLKWRMADWAVGHVKVDMQRAVGARFSQGGWGSEFLQRTVLKEMEEFFRDMEGSKVWGCLAEISQQVPHPLVGSEESVVEGRLSGVSQYTFEVEVTRLGGKNGSYRVSAECTVLELKEMVDPGRGDMLQLICRGRELWDDLTLAHYGIEADVRIHSSLRLGRCRKGVLAVLDSMARSERKERKEGGVGEQEAKRRRIR